MGSPSARSPHGSQHPSGRPGAGKIPYRVMNRRRKGRRISSHSPQGKGMNRGRPQWLPSRSSLTAGRARRRYRDYVPFFPGRPAVGGFHRRRHQPRAGAGPFGDTTDLTFHRISTAPAPAPSGPASPVDHCTVELKAWIPQATAPATINSPVVCAVGQYMGAPKYYKRDNHTGYDGSVSIRKSCGYRLVGLRLPAQTRTRSQDFRILTWKWMEDGSYRVLVPYSFTWDGKEIGDIATDAEYGATHLMQDGCPDLVKTVTSLASEGDVTVPGAVPMVGAVVVPGIAGWVMVRRHLPYRVSSRSLPARRPPWPGTGPMASRAWLRQ